MKDSLIKAKKIEIVKPYFYKSPQSPKSYIQSDLFKLFKMPRQTVSWTDAPFNWPAQPELDEKELNSPQPCGHGAGCTYNGPCAFVHPGEEGMGRRLFPGRTVEDKDGNEIEQAAAVRLIGSPGFYERRRLKMSWPQWCAKKGIKVASPAVPAPAAGAKPASSWPSLPQAQMQPQAQAQMQMQPQAQMQTYAQPQMQLWQMQQMQQMHQMHQMQHMQQMQQMAQTVERLQTSLQASQNMSRADKAELRNLFGDNLYQQLTPFLAEIKEQYTGTWPESATAGKIVGMFLELENSTILDILLNKDTMSSKVTDALEILGGRTSSA